MLAKSQSNYRSSPPETHHYFEKAPFPSQDIILYHCGEHERSLNRNETCQQEHCLIHIVYQGEGRFWPNTSVDSEPVLIKAGDIFLIPPGTKAIYQGDNNNPWSYCWLGIQGQMAEAALEFAGFNSQQQTHHYPMTIIHSIIEAIQSLILSSEEHSVNPLEKLSQVYRILGLMCQATKQVQENPAGGRSKSYLDQAHAFISNHYHRKISLDDISGEIGITRKHLSSLFREKYGQSLKNYLTTFRMRRACELLRQQPPLPVDTVASLVGYEDIHGFSKMFRKYMTVSPSQYREKSKCIESICSGILK